MCITRAAHIAWILGNHPFLKLTTKDTKYTNKYKAEDVILFQQAFSFVYFGSFVVPSICILVPASPGYVKSKTVLQYE